VAKAIATLNHILKGRLTINIFSSNFLGTELSFGAFNQRLCEVIEIL